MKEAAEMEAKALSELKHKKSPENKKGHWKKGKRKWIVTGILCLCVVALAGFFIKRPKAKQSEKSKVREISVETGTIKNSISGTGTISYADSTDIVLPADLELKELLVDEGSYVEEGTLLATVNEDSLALCLSEVQEAISETDSTISSEKSSSTSKNIKAGVSGRVKKIYGKEGDSVIAVMNEQGELMLLSSDGLMAVDINSAANLSVGDSVTVSSGDTQADGTVERVESDRAVVTFDDSVFEYEEEVSVNNQDGVALGGGVSYIHQPISVVGTAGNISSVNVSENDKVNASTKVYTIEGDINSTEYMQAIKEREQLTSLLNTLVSIQANGGITAPATGMIETIAAQNTSSSGSGGAQADMADSNSESALRTATVSFSEGEETGETVLAENTADSDITTQEISQTTASGGMQLLSAAGTGASVLAADMTAVTEIQQRGTTNTAKAEKPAPENLTGGDGVIEGTTPDMEYADSENAGSWTVCNNGETAVKAGDWYVRYKETDETLASPAVKVTVTANAVTETAQTEKDDKKDSTETDASNQKNDDSDKDQKTEDTDSEKTSQSENQSGKTGGNGKSAGGAASVTTSAGKASASGSSVSSSDSDSASIASVETLTGFTIAYGDKMKVTMNVDEMDILNMKTGLSAEITLDAVADTTFAGTITAVSQSAESSGGTAQYPVEITFDKTDEMYQGMNASAEVIMEQAENVLVIPVAAVEDEGSKSYVYTGYEEGTGELTDKIEVTLGMSDETYVEVESGLSQGDTIYYQMAGSEDDSSQSGFGGFGMPGQMDGMEDRHGMKMDGQGRGNRSGDMSAPPTGGTGGQQ